MRVLCYVNENSLKHQDFSIVSLIEHFCFFTITACICFVVGETSQYIVIQDRRSNRRGEFRLKSSVFAFRSELCLRSWYFRGIFDVPLGKLFCMHDMHVLFIEQAQIAPPTLATVTYTHRCIESCVLDQVPTEEFVDLANTWK